MKTISVYAPIAKTSSKVQVLKAVARLRRSKSPHILLDYGMGIALWAGITLCAALLFVFGLFLLNGWCVLFGIATGILSYMLFTNNDYGDYSIKEALEALAAGKEVGK